MVEQTRWVGRTFEFNQPIGIFPCILERFRGTPARLEEMIREFPPSILTTRVDGGWSIQEHAGHLWDLEELGEKRLSEFLARASTLKAADMQNKKTYEANHNGNSIVNILREFRKDREGLVRKLDQLDEEQVGISSIHPRLNKPMRVIDWVYFMAEHDDHHLARMRGLGRILRHRSKED